MRLGDFRMRSARAAASTAGSGIASAHASAAARAPDRASTGTDTRAGARACDRAEGRIAPGIPGAGRRRTALALLGALALTGCARRWPAGLDVDTSLNAVSQDSRVRFIVLHYTDGSQAASLRTLSQGDVSAHYLVSDEQTGPGRVRVYNLVPEDRNAWHAGESSWFGRTALNNASIGIEITNSGPAPGPDGETRWEPYTEAQIRTVILLVRDIARRHGVLPENIVGHSDIAPQRKTDPGPAFPWGRLAREGLGRWYDEDAALAASLRYQAAALPDASWFQEELARVGYDAPCTGVFDPATTLVIAAFQMHYRPSRADGAPDAETAGILSVLGGEAQ